MASLLSSCVTGVPDDISDYLSQCSFKTAYEWVKTAELSYEAVQTDLSGQTLGTSHIQYHLDQRDIDDLYAYYDGSFSGTLATEKTEDGMIVLSKSNLRYKNSSASGYTAEREVNGDRLETLELTYSVMKGTVTTFFYSQQTESYYLSGLYYADSLRLSLKFHQFMSIDENGDFIYHLDGVGSLGEDGKLASVVTETFKMNEYGMLFSLVQKIEDLGQQTVTESTLTVNYNSENFVRKTTLDKTAA